MKNGGKHISIFLTVLAGMILLFHAVFPHHHHFNSFSAFYCETPQTYPDRDSHPVHCSAFNDIVIDKTDKAGDILPQVRMAILISATAEPMQMTVTQNENTVFVPDCSSPPKNYILSSSLLRAPPCKV